MSYRIKPQPDPATAMDIRSAITAARGTDEDVDSALHAYALAARRRGTTEGEVAALRNYFLTEGMSAPKGQRASVLGAVEAAYRRSYPRLAVVAHACCRQPSRVSRNAGAAA